MALNLGLDFGTTNSALAAALPDGSVRLAPFRSGRRTVTTFRSILYCDPTRPAPGAPPPFVAGPAAIDAYLQAETRGRLIQSFKSFLSSRLFTKTRLYGASYSLEDLVGTFLRGLRREAEMELGELGSRVVVGRPVTFSGAESEDDARLAVERLRVALGRAGFTEVVFEYEPVAAAHHYATRIEQEQLVLIADFGGGTSDFSLIRLRPPSASAGEIGAEILGTAGVPIGGDSFDTMIVRHLVSPGLGRGGEYLGLNREPVPIPLWIYGALERWHHLSFLNNRDTLHLLRSISTHALEREKVQALIDLVEHNMGYGLYRSVEEAKHRISDASSSLFRFHEPPVRIEAELERYRFEEWIDEDLEKIEACVVELLGASGVAPEGVDRVFMTGGSSFVPSIRGIFERRFGPARLQGGGELTSVAEGLALRARALFRD